MNGKGSGTTQTQQVSQSTSVTVQNVIEDRGLEPLEKAKFLVDIFSTIDRIDNEKKATGPQTVFVQPQTSPFAFLSDPLNLGMITAAAAVLILLAKKAQK